MSEKIDVEHLKKWLGSERETFDIITPRLANGLAAVLDEPCDLKAGDLAPVGIHWCLSPDIVPMSGLGADGHPARGAFLPPVQLPRRMWAGGELCFSSGFRVGDSVRRLSRVDDIAVKAGRSGTLCFVTVHHEYSVDGNVILNERHDIVYRALEAPSDNKPPKADFVEPDMMLEIDGTPTLLMRYSAVTFNGHRIHYDRDYCIDEEFYPGLIVHGPLQANYVLRMAYQLNDNRLPKRFSFRGLSPLFDGSSFTINAKREDSGNRFWVLNADGAMTMQAQTSDD